MAHFPERLVRESSFDYNLSDEVLRTMVDYAWPGNVHELEHTIQRGATISSGPLLQLAYLSAQLVDFALQQRRTIHPEGRGYADTVPYGANGHEAGSGDSGFDSARADEIVPLAMQEKQAIFSTLDTLKGDQLLTAKVLSIGKTTRCRKLKEYGIGDLLSAPPPRRRDFATLIMTSPLGIDKAHLIPIPVVTLTSSQPEAKRLALAQRCDCFRPWRPVYWLITPGLSASHALSD